MHQEIGILPHTFTELDRSNHFKKIMKSRNVVELIMNLEHLVSAEDDVTKNCKIFKLYFTMENQRKLMWKQGCDCTISKKQRTRYHCLQILCHASKLIVERIISHIFGCILLIKFCSNFH